MFLDTFPPIELCLQYSTLRWFAIFYSSSLIDQISFFCLFRFLRSKHIYNSNGGCTLSFTECFSRLCCPVCGRRSGNYLTLAYLFIKVLFIANVLGQLFIMDSFLGTDFHFYGIDVISSLFNGSDWRDSPRFPRVTMCDFRVRRLGNVQRYTVQCVLTINLFNEMIYLFIWFWMIFVAIMSCISLLKWSLRSLSRQDRRRYIKKHLTLLNKLDTLSDNNKWKDFVDIYLGCDGVLVMRLIGHNTDAVTVTEFVCALWDYNCANQTSSIA